jgi:hypothetical protein
MTLGSPNGIPIRFVTSNAERARITSGGYVGIGTTSPSHKLDVQGRIRLKDSNHQVIFHDTDTGVDEWSITTFSDTGLSFYDGAQAGSAAMTLLSGGNVGIGTTAPSYNLDVNNDIRSRTRLRIGTYGAYLSYYYSYTTTNSEFRVGYASSGTYAVCRASAFTVSSDYRLKENIEPLKQSIDRLKQLKVYRFNWKDKLDEDKVDGFIAHEVSDVIPEAVVGEKDEINQDGEPEHQGIDQSKIVPLLTAALQEAITKIEQLETRIQTLENN